MRKYIVVEKPRFDLIDGGSRLGGHLLEAGPDENGTATNMIAWNPRQTTLT